MAEETLPRWLILHRSSEATWWEIHRHCVTRENFTYETEEEAGKQADKIFCRPRAPELVSVVREDKLPSGVRT